MSKAVYDAAFGAWIALEVHRSQYQNRQDCAHLAASAAEWAVECYEAAEAKRSKEGAGALAAVVEEALSIVTKAERDEVSGD